MATMAFNKNLNKYYVEACCDLGSFIEHDEYMATLKNKLNTAMFDSRCFNIPKEEVTNCFLWRQQDATRNAIRMLGYCHYSSKAIENVSNNELQDMLMTQKGINFNDMPTEFKRGVCCVKEEYPVEDLSTYSGPIEPITRTRWVLDKEIPIFTQDRDYVGKYV
jgi:tRNA(His) 5'-end guanylyltransferase